MPPPSTLNPHITRGSCASLLLEVDNAPGGGLPTPIWMLTKITGAGVGEVGVASSVSFYGGPENGFTVTVTGVPYAIGLDFFVLPVDICAPLNAAVGEWEVDVYRATNFYRSVYNGPGELLSNLFIGDGEEEPPLDTTPPSVPDAPTTPATEEGVCEGAQVTLSWEAT